jgi:exodeoxyribonuclease VII large subunit
MSNLTKNEHIFTVSELSDYLKSIISNKKIKVIGEVSQPVLRGGHLYFSLKDDSSNIKSIVWKSKNIDKESISEGQKLTLECKLDFYGGNGTINLIVDKIITQDGSGELFIKYEKIKQEFTIKGYFDKSRKKQLPQIIKNILILTSEKGAALQDFIYNLDNNKSLINYDIQDVKVQGTDCPKTICEYLEQLKKTNIIYDLVVITRGGGSFEELFGFSQPELIESVYNFHLPVLSAIGHQVDNPLLDLIADISSPTPSLAAQFIVDYNKKFISGLEKIRDNIKSDLLNEITERQNMLSKLNEKIYKLFNRLVNLKNDCQNLIRNDIGNLMVKLSILESKVQINLNKNITLYSKSNEKITSTEDLEFFIGQFIKLRWADKEYKIKVIEKNENLI